MTTQHFIARLIGLVGAVLLAACTPTTLIPVVGDMDGQHIATTVDAEVVRYYLENYLPGKPANPDLDSKIDALNMQYKNSLPTREQLADISREYSVDFATLFYADRLLANDCNKNLNRAFQALLKRDEKTNVDTSAYVLLFVPGWDYAENGHLTGADFAQPRKLVSEFGVQNYLVEIPPTGSVEANAAVVAAQIHRHAALGKNILLAGASSAGPAIHLALSELLEAKDLRNVKAWLNLGGILQGSPLVDFMQSWPQRWLFNVVVWWKNWDRDSILSMSAATSRQRFQKLKLPGELLVMNYLGVPLSGQLSRYASDKYPLLKSYGPNDGLTLLTDVIAPNSLTVVALGSDHFFAEDAEINRKTIALMKLIFGMVERQPTATATALCATTR